MLSGPRNCPGLAPAQLYAWNFEVNLYAWNNAQRAPQLRTLLAPPTIPKSGGRRQATAPFSYSQSSSGSTATVIPIPSGASAFIGLRAPAARRPLAGDLAVSHALS
jgi:hypothetical protein